MIFVTVGSQKFQFDRLLKKLDELVDSQIIGEEVFAQIGYCEYCPQNFQYKKFLDREEYIEKMRQSDVVITHAGTGAIMGAVKAGKKVIAVPRQQKYGEHVDDHQWQIVKVFSKLEIIEPCFESEALADCILRCKERKYRKYVSKTKYIIENIEKFIDRE